MFTTNCLAYSNLTAELRQQQECFGVTLRDPDHTEMHVTLSYTQTKTLTEGLLAMLSQVSLKDVAEKDCGHIVGDMTVTFVLPQEKANQQEGGEEPCRQNILSARTEAAFLFKSA